MVRNNRFRRDARAPDEDEEMWFSQDDENDDDSSPQVLEILKNKLDSDLDRIHRLWENKKGEWILGAITLCIVISGAWDL